MNEETWKELQKKAVLGKLFPHENPQDNSPFYSIWGDYLNRHRQRAVRFINQLLENNVSLSDIGLNDFESNSSPAVYVANKRYTRLARNDYKLVLKHLHEKKSKNKF